MTSRSRSAIGHLVHSLNEVVYAPLPDRYTRSHPGHNRSAVVNTIKTHGPVSRTEISKRTRLSPAAITGTSAYLIQDGLVYEKAPGDSRGGRRPILLALNPHGRCVVGLKLTEDHAIGALTDLEATVLVNRTSALSGRSPDAVVTSLAEAVASLLREGRMRKKLLLGVGVGLAGIVDAEAGILRQSPFSGWRDTPLRQMLRKQVGVPVYIDNDVNTLTLAERWFGAGRGVDDFLTITIGRGVRLGIVANGQFYRGARGCAGEFGHTIIESDGPICGCGKKGCLETFVSDPGLLRMYTQGAMPGVKAPSPKTPEELLALAQAGDKLAQAVYSRAGDLLGRGVANLINLLDPGLILIGGERVRAGEWLFGPLRESVIRNVMPGLAGDAKIHIHPWDDNAWGRGAASLVLRELFESPLHRSGAMEG